MSRGDSLARQLQLMRILEDRRVVAVPEVAHELGYTQRTVYRDLAVLERVGVPIYQERSGKRARWRVVEGYRRRLSLTLSWSELFALAAARRLLSGLGTPFFAEAAEAALEKITAALPEELARRAERMGAALSAGPAFEQGVDAVGGVVRVLAEAVEASRTVRLRYLKPGRKSVEERLVDPYLLHLQGRALYLIGYCHRRAGVRTFLLDRIKSAEQTGAGFQARAPFSPPALLQGGFGPWEASPQKIKLRFQGAASALVAERRVHPSQRSQWRSDGGLDVELRVPVCPPVVAWVLGWGASVEVLGPALLARRVQAEHAEASRRSR